MSRSDCVSRQVRLFQYNRNQAIRIPVENDEIFDVDEGLLPLRDVKP